MTERNSREIDLQCGTTAKMFRNLTFKVSRSCINGFLRVGVHKEAPLHAAI